MKSIGIKFTAMLAFGLFTIFSLSSCEKDDDDDMPVAPPGLPTIVEIATSDNDFSILVAALTKANLVTTLQGNGPFTVFAPTNAAFTQLLNDLGVGSLDDLTAEQLEPILLNHVVGAKVLSSDLSNGYVSTLSPGFGISQVSLQVNIDNNVTLNGTSLVTTADVEASNGVVHVINKVLLPPTVVDIAINNSNFSILVDAVVKADLATTLNGDGPFTVFAPTNDAFQALFNDLGISGIDDLTAADLTPILLYHVVSGNVLSSDLATGDVTTLNGSDISIDVGNGVSINNNTNVVLANVQGTNGVVHVINKVLVPPAN